MGFLGFGIIQSAMTMLCAICAAALVVGPEGDGAAYSSVAAAALDVPAVNLSKKWIAEHGEKAWGM